MRPAAPALLAALLAASPDASAETGPVWPPPPDRARVEHVEDIEVGTFRPRSGLFGKLVRLLGGAGDRERLSLPFDVLAAGDALYLTCQNLPALVEADPASGRFRLYECDERPFVQPIALAGADGAIFVTDSGNGTVYRFDGRRVLPLIREGLERPTGIAVLPGAGRLYVVDTGSHEVRIFDLKGSPLGVLGGRAEADAGLNFPTFATSDGETVLLNDTLNYRIKRFDREGRLQATFGEEGDGPGTFARPKGLAVDGDGHVWVTDALFDNIQVFDEAGRLLLVIGAAGQGPGQFWSPGGIDIAADKVYVADTFNNRVQVLRYLGE